MTRIPFSQPPAWKSDRPVGGRVHLLVDMSTSADTSVILGDAGTFADSRVDLRVRSDDPLEKLRRDVMALRAELRESTARSEETAEALRSELASLRALLSTSPAAPSVSHSVSASERIAVPAELQRELQGIAIAVLQEAGIDVVGVEVQAQDGQVELDEDALAEVIVPAMSREEFRRVRRAFYAAVQARIAGERLRHTTVSIRDRE